MRGHCSKKERRTPQAAALVILQTKTLPSSFVTHRPHTNTMIFSRSLDHRTLLLLSDFLKLSRKTLWNLHQTHHEHTRTLTQTKSCRRKRSGSSLSADLVVQAPKELLKQHCYKCQPGAEPRSSPANVVQAPTDVGHAPKHC